MTEAYAVTAGLAFGLSLYGLLSPTNLVQRLIAANIMASSVFLYLVLLSQGTGIDIAGRADGDPVPRAVVLTGIVIAVSITAFGLNLARWLQAGKSTANRPGEEGAGKPGDAAGSRDRPA